MNIDISANTQAILLLTAPLITGAGSATKDVLSPGEYKRLARCLHDLKLQPEELLSPRSEEILQHCRAVAEIERIRSLLARGFQLSQALERWRSRAIWVVSRADDAYPRRLKDRLRGEAPPILYGSGDPDLLERGGLAIVGSRAAGDALEGYTVEVAGLVAHAGRSVVSGGARGIDQAAMRGALEAGGRVCGVLADSLERQAMHRGHRNLLMEGRLTLVSPYDPGAGFNVGNAMQRNKLIYALADVSLVVSSDVNKGGTWAGAVEQLNRFRFCPVYVRSVGELSAGLNELRRKGAVPWPNPNSAADLDDLLRDAVLQNTHHADTLPFGEQGSSPPASLMQEVGEESSRYGNAVVEAKSSGLGCDGRPESPDADDPAGSRPADTLFLAAREAICRLLVTPMKEGEVASALDVSVAQARAWLQRLSKDGVVQKSTKPVLYRLPESRLL